MHAAADAYISQYLITGTASVRTRGFVDVVNRFGGNCFACHVKAKPEWDLICETGHGCDAIPLTPLMIKALQKTDRAAARQWN